MRRNPSRIRRATVGDFDVERYRDHDDPIIVAAYRFDEYHRGFVGRREPELTSLSSAAGHILRSDSAEPWDRKIPDISKIDWRHTGEPLPLDPAQHAAVEVCLDGTAGTELESSVPSTKVEEVRVERMGCWAGVHQWVRTSDRVDSSIFPSRIGRGRGRRRQLPGLPLRRGVCSCRIATARLRMSAVVDPLTPSISPSFATGESGRPIATLSGSFKHPKKTSQARKFDSASSPVVVGRRSR